MAIINDLRPLYLENWHDIHHVNNMEGDSILQAFLRVPSPEPNKPPLFHSANNMGPGRNNVLLTTTSNHTAAIEYLGTIHKTLFASIDPVFHPVVFLNSDKFQLVS